MCRYANTWYATGVPATLGSSTGQWCLISAADETWNTRSGL